MTTLLSHVLSILFCRLRLFRLPRISHLQKKKKAFYVTAAIYTDYYPLWMAIDFWTVTVYNYCNIYLSFINFVII